MLLKKQLLKDSRLYLVLDKDVCIHKNIKGLLLSAILGGVDIIQYRDKQSPSRTMIKEAACLFKIAKKFNKPFIINDRIDVALAVDADGIHLGQDDLTPQTARKILGSGKIIGLSCHSVSDVKKAQNKSLDYLGFGPIFKTLTKPKAQPRGIKLLSLALKNSSLPIFAIGGITLERLKGLEKNKNLKIAAIRAICLAPHAEHASAALKGKLKNV